jgi:Cd2+/Zn2+-exporting ATPase
VVGARPDIVLEAADVVIMKVDLRRFPETIRLSSKTQAIQWQSIALPLGVKVVFSWIALFHCTTMWVAVYADMGVRLLRCVQ